jgi:hypothetical protein
MSWKSHEDGTLITNEHHQTLSAEEKIKFYETSEEAIVTSTSKKLKNGKAVDSEGDSLDQA